MTEEQYRQLLFELATIRRCAVVIATVAVFAFLTHIFKFHL